MVKRTKKARKTSSNNSAKSAEGLPDSNKKPATDSELELESANALRGADDFRNRLLIAMAVGSPSISELAYAVKVRVKEDYKIVEKVLRKRAANDPSYGVPNLRDIVGVRIVTLYRLDALRIIPLLLQKLKDEADGPSALFIPDSIEEIIIYTNNPDGDAQALPGRILDVFGAFGLKDKVQVAGAPTNYTSIHLVAFGRGKYADGYREIPVEIQIRTALEDVWGEIDHALKYKRKTVMAPNMPGKRRVDSVLSHLNVMKTLIDGTAQYADQIKIQLDELNQDDGLTSASPRHAEDALELIRPFSDLPTDVRSSLEDAVRHDREAFLQLSSSSKENELLGISNLYIAVDGLDVAAAALRNSRIAENTRTVVVYVIDMEKALVLYELGKRVESGANLLAEAAKTYVRYEKEYPSRALIKYRLACVLDALGDRSSARGKFRETLEIIKNDSSDLPAGHWIRAATPRYLGTMLWEDASRLEKASLGSVERQFLINDSISTWRPTK